MKNSKYSLFALAIAAALPLSVQSKELSYTYLEADYANLENNTDGWGVRGSVNFGDSGVYGLGSFGWLHADTGLGDFDIRTDEFGVGYHHALSDKADLIGELAYQNADYGSLNIDGLRSSIGVRGALAERVEGFVKANYYDLSDYSGDVSGTIGGQFKFNDTWGATAEAELGDGDQSLLVGVRASF